MENHHNARDKISMGQVLQGEAVASTSSATTKAVKDNHILEIVSDTLAEVKRHHEEKCREEITALWKKNEKKRRKAIGELLISESKNRKKHAAQTKIDDDTTETPTSLSSKISKESPLKKEKSPSKMKTKSPSKLKSDSSPKSSEPFSLPKVAKRIAMPSVERWQPMAAWTLIPRNYRDPAPNAYEPQNIPYFENEVFKVEKKLIEVLEENFAEGSSTPQHTPKENQIFFETVHKLVEVIGEEEIFKAMNQISPDEGSVEELKERYAALLAMKKPPVNECVPNIDDASAHTQSQKRVTALSTFVKLFCRRCLIYDCLVHPDKEENFISPEYISKKGNWLLPQEPCGPVCHWKLNSEPGSSSGGCRNSQSLTPSDETTFRVLKDVYPGNICLIASIMMKNCNEVYELSLKDNPQAYVPSLNAVATYIAKPDLSKSKVVGNKGTKGQRAGMVWGNLNAEALTERARMVYRPCGHPGIPCGEYNDCSCRLTRTPCEKYCACPPDCKHRFLGCRCESTCDTKQCPCYAAGRECDPDLCFACGSSEPDISKLKCKNVPIQRMMKKKLRLAKSDVPNGGWGIFAGERIAKNELVSEYVGDLITMEEGDRRELVYTARLHTYLFDLNDDYVIDATRKGSKIRFANHSSSPNTMFKVMRVNTDHRIGIYANRNIEAGEEIFLYYEEVLEAHSSTIAERKKEAAKERKAEARKRARRCSESDMDYEPSKNGRV